MDARYWQNRYESGDTPWDIGGISPAILDILTLLPSKDLRILIPGAGFGHEAKWLHERGFSNVTVCDWAPSAMQGLLTRCPDFPKDHLLTTDFFTLGGLFDLILEQTFLSALPQEKWPQYADQCKALLAPEGYLTGLLFATPFKQAGPPFGATIEDYVALLDERFNQVIIYPTPRSIGPRQGNELFFKASQRHVPIN